MEPPEEDGNEVAPSYRLDGRRCLHPEEMEEHGMEVDPRGRWRIVMADGARERLSALKGSVLSASEA